MNMKKLRKYLVLLVIAICATSCNSCSDNVPDEPTVTSVQVQSSSTHYPNFGATVYQTLYDKNRICPTSSSHCFRVTKTNGIINSADRCDYCGSCWYAHREKN